MIILMTVAVVILNTTTMTHDPHHALQQHQMRLSLNYDIQQLYDRHHHLSPHPQGLKIIILPTAADHENHVEFLLCLIIKPQDEHEPFLKIKNTFTTVPRCSSCLEAGEGPPPNIFFSLFYCRKLLCSKSKHREGPADLGAIATRLEVDEVAKMGKFQQQVYWPILGWEKKWMNFPAP